jgi:hypothetical protein
MQICLVYEGRRLQRVITAFPLHTLMRQAPQVVVHKWNQLLQRAVVAMAPFFQELRHLLRIRRRPPSRVRFPASCINRVWFLIHPSRFLQKISLADDRFRSRFLLIRVGADRKSARGTKRMEKSALHHNIP